MSLAPLAQRRDAQRHHLEAVVEVLAEAPLGDLLLEVAVGGRDQAEVDLDQLAAADAHDLPLLEHAQELDLQLGVELADLVEEERAAVRQLELADLARRSRR